MMKKILYGSIFCIWYLMSLLPLRVLYILSDGLFYLIYYVVKYRRPLVRKHLFDSFPEKSEAERIKIEKEFYSWFCDYIVETIKLFTMSKKQVMKRMQFIGAEKVRESCQKGQSCAIYLGHYCNWDGLPRCKYAWVKEPHVAKYTILWKTKPSTSSSSIFATA